MLTSLIPATRTARPASLRDVGTQAISAHFVQRAQWHIRQPVESFGCTLATSITPSHGPVGSAVLRIPPSRPALLGPDRSNRLSQKTQSVWCGDATRLPVDHAKTACYAADDMFADSSSGHWLICLPQGVKCLPEGRKTLEDSILSWCRDPALKHDLAGYLT